MFKEANKKLKTIREHYKYSAKKFSEFFDDSVSEYKIRDIEKGKSSLTDEMIEVLEKQFNINKYWLFFDEGEMLNKPSNLKMSNESIVSQILNLLNLFKDEEKERIRDFIEFKAFTEGKAQLRVS